VLVSGSWAKLSSSRYNQEQAKEIVERVFRETNLDAGMSFWGERHKEEIARMTRLFKTSYYQVFGDLGIEGAMARCAVMAKHETDFRRWFSEMDRFDRAAEELNQRDRSRYYFAKGLALVQVVPERLHEVPEAFYKAAENGYSSEAWAQYVMKSGVRTAGIGTQALTRVLAQFAESYARGGYPQEAFKVYMLAVSRGSDEPDHYVRMISLASELGSHKLAFKCALLFLEASDAHDGMRSVDRRVGARVKVDPQMPADEFQKVCETVAIDAALAARSKRKPHEDPIKPRYLSRFDSRYVQPITQNVGAYEELFEAAVCERYWNDSSVVVMFLSRIGGPIDAHGGALMPFVEMIRQDPRFSKNASIALWEARRWKDAGKLEEFAQRFPERYALSGLGGDE